MTDTNDEGQLAFEPTPLSALELNVDEPVTVTTPPAAAPSTAAEEPAPAAPPHESPVEVAGAVAPEHPVETEPQPIAPPVPEPEPVQPQAPLTAEAIGAVVAAAMQQFQPQQSAPQPQQPQQPAPDWYENPEAAFAHHQQQAARQAETMRMNMSDAIARDAIEDYSAVMGENNAHWEAYLSANPHVWTRVTQSAHPAKTAYDLLKQEQLVTSIQGAGGLDAIKQKAIEEYKASLTPQDVPPAAPPAPVAAPTAQPVTPQIPTMMGDDHSAPPKTQNGWTGPTPLEVIDATSPGRRKRTG